MTLTKEQIQTAAMNLNPAEREALAEALLRSIDEVGVKEIDDAWLAEAHRRDIAYQAGKMRAKPVRDVLDRLSSKASK